MRAETMAFRVNGFSQLGNWLLAGIDGAAYSEQGQHIVQKGCISIRLLCPLKPGLTRMA